MLYDDTFVDLEREDGSGQLFVAREEFLDNLNAQCVWRMAQRPPGSGCRQHRRPAADADDAERAWHVS